MQQISCLFFQIETLKENNYLWWRFMNHRHWLVPLQFLMVNLLSLISSSYRLKKAELFHIWFCIHGDLTFKIISGVVCMYFTMPSDYTSVRLKYFWCVWRNTESNIFVDVFFFFLILKLVKSMVYIICLGLVE